MERFWTFFYDDMLKRNTVDPLRILCSTEDLAEVKRLLPQWSRRKIDESKYIQVAVWYNPREVWIW